ncbi:transcriptional regulator TACO1-like protein [Cunninghamella echinulata]|nr:transcriptional regulator TACO1-like protein [Cunninghamella echinulata]
MVASIWCQQQRFAGHNKWSKVKHTKGAKDAKKSKLFSKIALEITSAVRAGGSDPNLNTRLNTILNRAKANSMTKDSIETAIKKATDKNRDAMEDVLYECYGPGGIAVIVEAVTDKKSRTVKEVKEVLNRVGGSISSVGWLFEKKGKIVFTKGESGHTLEQMMDEAIEAGAEDIEEYENDEEMENKEEELVEITCDFTELNNISKFLTSNHKYEIRQLEATYVPQSSMEISDPELIESVTKCLDDMENLDDVVKVYTNATIAE